MFFCDGPLWDTDAHGSDGNLTDRAFRTILSQKYLATWQGCLCVLLGAQASCSPRRHEDEESQKDFFASSCLRGEAFWLRLGCSVFIRRIREVPWPIAPFFRKKYVTVFSKERGYRPRN